MVRVSWSLCVLGVVVLSVLHLGSASGDVFNMGGVRNADGSWTGLASLETVPVGNPGNALDTRYETPGYGSVGYEYNIGKYEVTAGQYTEFLNAVARTDTYGLYNLSMWSSSDGCNIQQTGTAGNYMYSVAADWANRPVNYVSWGDAARFANWLHNGQPAGSQSGGTTEDGAYLLNGAIYDADLLAVTRQDNWKWAISTADEWYKAAYHKNDGETANYFDHPMRSDSVLSNEITDPDPGNNANFKGNEFTIGSPYYRTEVGEFENSESPYGTFDQGGNVWEWTESISIRASYHRSLWGGSFYMDERNLHAQHRNGTFPTGGDGTIGFRVTAVPEPAMVGLVALGALGLVRRKRRSAWAKAHPTRFVK